MVRLSSKYSGYRRQFKAYLAKLRLPVDSKLLDYDRYRLHLNGVRR
jgi:hypothetical protein